MNVCIIGAGYVGLVTGACFAERGHQVVCIDSDLEKVAAINRGESPIHEENLSGLLSRNVGKRLRAQNALESAVESSDVILICVGTPFRNGEIDLSFVLKAAEQIGHALSAVAEYKVVVVKSTVIPGTTIGPVRATLERASGKVAGKDFGIGMNPEFLTEGTAVQDFMEPDRLVIGGIDQQATSRIEELYESWRSTPRVLTNPSTAELIKYASNAVLATMISFSNELATLAASLPDVDIANVLRGLHLAEYFTSYAVGRAPVTSAITSYLWAGCGFGGSCLPKDVSALVAQGSKRGVDMPLLRSVLQVNEGQPRQLVDLIVKHFPSLSGVKISVLGIAFKPDTDDVRESPAFPVIRLLKEKGAVVTAYDPIAKPVGMADLVNVGFAKSLEDAVAGAQVIVLVTSWKDFAVLPSLLRDVVPPPLVVDGRRALKAEDYARFEAIGVGTENRRAQHVRL